MNSTPHDRVRSFALWTCMLAAAGCGDNGTQASPGPDQGPEAGTDSPGPGGQAGPTKITLAGGDVQGMVSGQSRAFLGIPYAKPPIGDLRWAAPVAPDPWASPLDATRFGKRCPQLASALLQNAASNDEDCLNLNVWTPLKTTAPLPVMVWIHGGGNINGSTSEPIPFLHTGVFYSGENLAGNHGVVVVSMNYRLGLFGFFSHPALAAGAAGAPEGNQGLYDQRLALQWVKDNIAAFGGDPDRITIFGESAGSQDVCLHAASPGSIPLLSAAIGESGGCTTLVTPKATAEKTATDVAAALGCTGSAADALACLRAKTVSELMTSEAVTQRLTGASSGFGPNVDGDGGFIPAQPRTLYDTNKVAQIPYLFGSNTNEGTLFVTDLEIDSQDAYTAALAARYGDLGPAVGGLYDPDDFAGELPNQFVAAFAASVGDAQLICTTFDTAQRAARTGASVYLYNFDIPIPAALDPPGGHLGATHGAELTSVFGTNPAFTADEKAASDRIQRYWTNFARTGSPNGSGDPTWPAFNATDHNVRLNLTTSAPTTLVDYHKPACSFWQVVYGNAFGNNPTR